MQSGMVAWMEAWSEFAVSSESGPRKEDQGEEQERGRYGRESQLPGIVRVQVAEILAGMTWANVRR